MSISKITNEYITLSSTSEKKYLYSLNVVLTKKKQKKQIVLILTPSWIPGNLKFLVELFTNY